MAGVIKRKSDRARGKAGKWTGWYVDEGGKQRQFAGTTDKAITLEMARRREAQARMVREGLIDRRDVAYAAAAWRPMAEHVEDYRRDLLAKGDTIGHVAHVVGAIARLLADAGVRSVADLAPDRIRIALGGLRQRRSARTCNHSLSAVKAFSRWLERSLRIGEAPRGLFALRPYSEAEDRRVVRRVLTADESARLVSAAEAGPPLVAARAGRGGAVTGRISGPQRAALYRLALGTGFRAAELRTLTAERFALDGDAPTVTVLARYSKNRREVAQPITRGLAAVVRPFVEDTPPGRPVFPVPAKAGVMLRFDLERAGIPHRDAQGRVLDFHALRHSYVTRLIVAGADPRTVQDLARHSTITLTIDRYTATDDRRKRDALDLPEIQDSPADGAPR